MPRAGFDAIPVVDYGDVLRGERRRFLRAAEHALCDVGFMLLGGVPGFDAAYQAEMFRVAHAFFDLPEEEKAAYDVAHSPHFRGWARAPAGSVQRHYVEAYQFGLEQAPLARSGDRAAPLWRRISRGPNVWPAERLVPGFRSAVEGLHRKYFTLSRQLGHLICEMLGVPAQVYDRYFEAENPDLLAALNHYKPASELGEGPRSEVERAFKNVYGGGAHRDGAPFITLLIGDQPGLQVLAHDGRTWVDVPAIPGTIVVNIGTTLMKLSKGRLISTTHRVNNTLHTARRVSLPYFLLPKMDGDLIPFDEPQDRTGRHGRDRGLAYAVDRCSLFRDATDRWYKEEFADALRAFDEERRRRAKEGVSTARWRPGDDSSAPGAARL